MVNVLSSMCKLTIKTGDSESYVRPLISLHAKIIFQKFIGGEKMCLGVPIRYGLPLLRMGIRVALPVGCCVVKLFTNTLSELRAEHTLLLTDKIPEICLIVYFCLFSGLLFLDFIILH